MGPSAMAAAPVGPGRASGVKGSTVPWRRAGALSAPRKRHARGRRTLGQWGRSPVGDDLRHVPDAQVPVRAVAACRHASGSVTPEPVPQSYRAADPRPGTVRADTFRGRPLPSRTRGSRVVTHAWHWRTTARRPDEPARRSRPARARRSRRGPRPRRSRRSPRSGRTVHARRRHARSHCAASWRRSAPALSWTRSSTTSWTRLDIDVRRRRGGPLAPRSRASSHAARSPTATSRQKLIERGGEADPVRIRPSACWPPQSAATSSLTTPSPPPRSATSTPARASGR